MVIAHDSFFGFLNLFRFKEKKTVYLLGERPPYPIINSDPDLFDITNNMNAADFGASIVSSAIPIGRLIIRKSSGVNERLRRFTFNSSLGYGIGFGICMALYNSTARLSGMTENGLRWKYKLTPIKKYDFTSDYEKGTIWKYLRA